MIALSSAALAEEGAFISQANEQEATVGSTQMALGLTSMSGNVQEKAANWAVVLGNDSYLYQGNLQCGETEGGTAKADGANLALMVGDGNQVDQSNYVSNFVTDPQQDPGSLDLITIDHVNEAIVMGEYNYMNQSNGDEPDLTANLGPVNPNQSSFGLIIGDNNTLIQSNIIHNESTTNEFEGINQTQANAAYIFGFNSYVNQSNIAFARLEIESPFDSPLINQTAKNLAFAISACERPEFIPSCNNTSMSEECPTLPATPPDAPAYPLTEYPLDP